MKPVALVQKALHNSSCHGDIVFDPFGGSGSTLIACEHSERIAYLMEIDPYYVDTIIRRWQSQTRCKATLLNNNKTFNQLKEERKNVNK